MRNWTQFPFIIAIASYGISCNEPATFTTTKGDSASVKPEQTSDLLQKIQEPLEPNLDTSHSKISFNVKALKQFSLNIVETYADFEVQSLNTLNDRITYSGGVLKFSPDISDIGTVLAGKINLVDNIEKRIVEVIFNVEEPDLTQVECFTTPQPVIGGISPEQKWHSSFFNVGGSKYFLTYSSPVVGDIDNDGKVEVIGVYSTAAYNDSPSSIVVIDGSSGLEEWNSILGNTGISAESSTTPAIADIDNDGKAEIIVTDVYRGPTNVLKRQIVAIDYEGGNATVKFKYQGGTDDPYICGSKCMPAVADIDGDGSAEIVAGNVVLNSDGTKKFSLNQHAVKTYLIPVLADLISTSPGLEIIAGETVYSSSGAVIHKIVGCSGFSAVADLDKDNDMEQVCIGAGTVNAYSHLGTKLWTTAIPTIPNPSKTGGGGAPNIGDFNGDGYLEIGTAGGYYYAVFNHLGQIIWQSRTEDDSSLITGSTIFDFNGDGKVEVVYNDQQKLRIFNGASGEIIWETSNPSGTLTEYPIIANIDDTPSVEIITSAPTLGGIRAFRDPQNLWVSSRRVWNQYAYYPEIVSDKLKVTQNPKVLSGFRINTQGSIRTGDNIQLPDIKIIPSQHASSDGKHIKLYFYNQGQSKAIGINLELLQSGNTVHEKLYTADLAAGEGKVIEVPAETIDLENPLSFSINLNADGSYLYKECNVENNFGTFSLR